MTDTDPSRAAPPRPRRAPTRRHRPALVAGAVAATVGLAGGLWINDALAKDTSSDDTGSTDGTVVVDPSTGSTTSSDGSSSTWSQGDSSEWSQSDQGSVTSPGLSSGTRAPDTTSRAS